MRIHRLLPFFAIAACSHPVAPAPGNIAEPAAHSAASEAPRKAATDPAKRPIEEHVAELQKEALASRDAVDFVRAITREVGARSAGSAKDGIAIQWAEKRLAAEGFTSVHRESVTVSHWERGQASGAVVSKGKRIPLDLLALGSSGSTPPAGIDAQVVRVDSLAAAQALGRKELAGKILFLDVTTARERHGDGYGQNALARYLGSNVAAERGAAALVVRSISTDASVPHTGITEHAGTVSVALSGTSADVLRDALARDPKAKVHLESTAKSLAEVESANVVADIRGSERPDEIVLLGAHLDSWDVGEGASDDGAGCAIAIEAARLAAKHAPRRTLRVVLFASEETGATGAASYAKAHASELDKVVAVLEADTGEGRVIDFRATGAPEQSQSALDKYFSGVAADAGPDATTDSRANAGADRARIMQRIAGFLAPLGIGTDAGGAHPGPDVGSLVRRGVPGFQLRQDLTTYFDVHHSKLDVFEHIDQAALVQSTAAYAVVAYAAAEMDEALGRVPVK